MSHSNTNTQSNAKAALGKAAAELIENGMTIGLGTGSTVRYFLESLGKRCEEGLSIQAIPSSEQTKERAISQNIPLIDMNDADIIDLTIDGADEIDPQKRMIKGGGGALLREKILASSSKEMVVIAGEEKLVEKLGKHPLPVEVIPFGHLATLAKLAKAGYHGNLRKHDREPFVTDNGNFIVDITFSRKLDNPEKVHQTIKNIPGVVETGFFFNIAGRVLVSTSDGHVKTL